MKQDITCPVLCVGDKEDPLLTEELQNHALDASNDNPNIICTLTRTGGHLGWLEGWRGKSWSIKACGQYIEAVLEAEKLFRGGCSSPDSILGGQRLSLQL